MLVEVTNKNVNMIALHNTFTCVWFFPAFCFISAFICPSLAKEDTRYLVEIITWQEIKYPVNEWSGEIMCCSSSYTFITSFATCNKSLESSWDWAGPSSVRNWQLCKLMSSASCKASIGSTSIKILFLRGVLPLRSSCLEVVFHLGCLPLRSSSIEVVFQWGCRLIWPNSNV